MAGGSSPNAGQTKEKYGEADRARVRPTLSHRCNSSRLRFVSPARQQARQIKLPSVNLLQIPPPSQVVRVRPQQAPEARTPPPADVHVELDRGLARRGEEDVEPEQELDGEADRQAQHESKRDVLALL